MIKRTHIIIPKTTDIKLSNNFTAKEMFCKCQDNLCVYSPIDMDLIEILQKLREDIVGVVKITSGHRCQTYNASIGGAKGSQHVNGSAADIQVAGKSPKEVYDYLDNKYPNTLGLGLYKTWVHVDTRQTKARWSK